MGKFSAAATVLFLWSTATLIPTAWSFSPRPSVRTSSSSSSRSGRRVSSPPPPLSFSFFSKEEEIAEQQRTSFATWLDRQNSSSPSNDQQRENDLRRLVGKDGTDRTEVDWNNAAIVGGVLGIGALLAAIAGSMDMSLSSANDVIHSAQELLQNPSETLERVINHVDAMGPLGMVYFGLIYVLAEVLAIPAIPLTASAGYLFGVVQGTGIVLVSASIAASISFFIGKTFLRSRVEEFIAESPKFQKLDKAIGKEGLKLMLLVRIAPIFPFALSNYLYGASSVEFGSYFLGTLLGFTPGTVAYVYTGTVGKALTMGTGGQPWYVYAGGLVALAGVLKLAADVATKIIEELEEE